MTKKLFITCLILFLFCFSTSCVFAKYTIETTHLAARLNIDCLKPNLVLLSISNSNQNYEQYANHTHTITMQVAVIEKHLTSIYMDAKHIQIKVGDTIISPTFQKISLLSQTAKERIYEIVLTNLTSDGKLSFLFPQGIAKDSSDLINDAKEFQTDIMIDNTPPSASFQESEIEQSKSQATITSTESIRGIPSWNFSSDAKVLSKDFLGPISYPLPLIDYAQNTANCMVTIQKAQNLMIEYTTYDASYNNFIIQSGGQIAGKNTILTNSLCKSEILAIRTQGHTAKSILQGKAFVYTYFGENSRGTCSYSELSYYYGPNPKTTTWFDINVHNWARFQGKVCTQFGGTPLNNSNQIPPQIASQYLYGISGATFRLVDFPNYSIVYQIYIKDIGWLKTAFDGQETMYRYDKPMTAIRMNLVPNSERSYLVSYWDQDIGTNHVP